MTAEPFSIVELRSPADPLLLPWLDLYEIAFPPGERIPVSNILNVLHDQICGEGRGRRILAAVDGQAQLVGMAYLYQPLDLDAGFLWYFAVAPQARCRGLGGWMYQRLLAQLRPTAKAMIFDLEDPRFVETPEDQDLARRRTDFYRRQGARLLGGIGYIQKLAPNQPELNLRVMVHPLAEISPDEAFDLAKPVLKDAITRVGKLHWE